MQHSLIQDGTYLHGLLCPLGCKATHLHKQATWPTWRPTNYGDEDYASLEQPMEGAKVGLQKRAKAMRFNKEYRGPSHTWSINNNVCEGRGVADCSKHVGGIHTIHIKFAVHNARAGGSHHWQQLPCRRWLSPKNTSRVCWKQLNRGMQTFLSMSFLAGLVAFN